MGAGGDDSGSTGPFVDEIRQSRIDKVDLLLVLDNSAGMLDKQQLLAQSLPLLVQRLVTPMCVDSEGNPVGGSSDASGHCGDGRAEFTPINDIHIGVISSSLGSHGADGPGDACVDPDQNDHAHLLGELRDLPDTYGDLGFLAWDAAGRYSPPGDSDAPSFAEKVSAMVESAGEAGCRYPATLEAWYRFLIDPEPPLQIVRENGRSVPQGLDQAILEQRAAFLRPDSTVAILMLSDKNDCSVIDEGYGHLIAGAAPAFRSTSQCFANPNDLCCQSCGEQSANEGCPELASDSECAKGSLLSAPEDNPGLRCFQQKRRFGFELLYPPSRYAEALRSAVVNKASSGELVQNPLFAAREGSAPRDRGLVFLAGIVGVPWQDLATEDSFAGSGLRYLSAAELASAGRWDVILGDPQASPPILPSDPFMVESAADRTTLPIEQFNPLTNDVLAPAKSINPGANPINGHEHVNIDDSELQYACIFPLPVPRQCAGDAGPSCDCPADAAALRRPLCQPPGGGEPGTEQFFAKAYPGLRHLQVLKEFGDNSVVASICPKVMHAAHPDYGYGPAITALASRLADTFVAKCFPTQLKVNEEDASVSCKVVEALPETADGCDCEALPRRTTASGSVVSAVRAELEAGLHCGSGSGVACDSFCLCELPQSSGAQLQECLNSQTPPDEPGFCYVSAVPNEPQVGNPDLVADCSADMPRVLRFVGGAPAPDSIPFIVCDEAGVVERPR